MAKSSLWAVQQAVYGTLTVNSGVIALCGDGLSPERAKVFDHVPEGTLFPYITIGESTAAPFDTKTADGMEQTLTVHVWSRYRGRKQAKQIMDSVATALDGKTLTVSGHTNVLTDLEFADTFNDPDGLTYHGVLRFRVQTQG